MGDAIDPLAPFLDAHGSQVDMLEITDKKSTYNEVRLYMLPLSVIGWLCFACNLNGLIKQGQSKKRKKGLGVRKGLTNDVRNLLDMK